jgi:hypothetical protein
MTNEQIDSGYDHLDHEDDDLHLEIEGAYLGEAAHRSRTVHKLDLQIKGLPYQLTIFTESVSAGPTAAEHSYDDSVSVTLLGKYGTRKCFPDLHFVDAPYPPKENQSGEAEIPLTHEQEERLFVTLHALIADLINERKKSWGDVFANTTDAKELMGQLRERLLS